MYSGVTGKGQSGQAAVESALVMPLMVFLCLGVIQLTMLEHAKIMTEYAAYNAARAGAVWDGNNERMHDAAIYSLLPVIGRTDNLGNLAKTWAIAKLIDTGLSKVKLGGTAGLIPDTFALDNLLGMIRIDTLSPSYWTPIGSVWNLPGGLTWKELDFDGPSTYPDLPDLVKRIAEFFNLDLPDDQEDRYRKATVLSIRVRFFYEMRIPFANWVIFVSWFAANAGRNLYGAIDRPTLQKSNMTNQTGDVGALGGMGKGIYHQKGFASVYPLEMNILWRIANGTLPLGISNLVGRHYFIPLTATYSMRMQSNFYRKWIMHFDANNGL